MGLNIGSLASGIGGSIPGVGGAIDLVGGLLGGTNKDPIRLDANAKAFTAAMAGNPNGLAYLKQRAGLNGVAFVGAVPGITDTPGNIGGWASALATQDANSKYQQVLGAAVAGSGGAATAAGPQGSTPATKAAATAETAARSVPFPLVLGGVAVLAYFLLRRR